MRRYSTKDEEAIRTLASLQDWEQSGFVGKDQSRQLAVDLQTDLKRTNFFFRAILFFFTAMLVTASLRLIVFAFDISEKNTTAILATAGAVVCFAVADLLAGRYRLYRFGVEEALAMASVVLISGAAASLASDEFRYQALAGLSTAVLSSLLVYYRFGYVYAGGVSMICAALIPFTLEMRVDAERMGVAAIFACLFAFVRRKRLLWDEDFPGDDYGVLQAAAWVGVYAAVNFQVGNPDHVHNALYWFTYAIIWLLPVAGLRAALKKKDRPFLQINVAMALVTLAANKPYLGLPRKPWDPILFGVLLISIAMVVKRWLASGEGGERYGFTPTRLLAGDKRIMTAIATASSLLQPSVSPSNAPPASPEPQFGGGRSGGAGASGEF